jgi:NAD(P)H-hydrate epimerase
VEENRSVEISGIDHGEVPAVTAAQMKEIDRVMVDVLGIDLVRMMENAGRHLARLAVGHLMDGDPRGRMVSVLVGRGGNGGGALVAARRLVCWGAHPSVWLARPSDELTPVPASQLAVLDRLGVTIHEEGTPAEAGDLILDGLIGYSLNGRPLGRARELIEWANLQRAPTLSLDLPSGLDATTGEVHGPAARAAATLTLAMPKCGLLASGADDYVGELFLGDIGVPPSAYDHVGLSVGPLFGRGEILRLT